MKFIEFGTKAVRIDKVEWVTLYRNEVSIQTANNRYTCYYQTHKDAEQAYQEILDKLAKEGWGNQPSFFQLFVVAGHEEIL